MEKPTQQEMFDYLDKLRVSGATNMLGASSYLIREFNLSKSEALQTLSAWMKQF